MSRSSRIPHPRGGRFVKIYEWAVRLFGLHEAAVIGVMDFLDSAQEKPNQPVASAARLIADLEGIVGKNSVYRAIEDLCSVGIIKKHSLISLGKRNIERRVEYSLDADEIAKILGTPETGSSGNSRFWESPELPESVPEPVPTSGVPSYYIKEKEVEAESSIAAAESKKKCYVLRQSGIVTWTNDDQEKAEAIERDYPQVEIAAAIKSLTDAGIEPLPGRVHRQIERHRGTRKVKERQEAANASHEATLRRPPESDPAAVERGETMFRISHIREKAAGVKKSGGATS